MPDFNIYFTVTLIKQHGIGERIHVYVNETEHTESKNAPTHIRSIDFQQKWKGKSAGGGVIFSTNHAEKNGHPYGKKWTLPLTSLTKMSYTTDLNVNANF